MLIQNVKIRKKAEKDKSRSRHSARRKFSLCCFVIVFTFALAACRSPQKIAMRSLLPNNAVAYLETDDLAKTLESLSGSPAFEELAVEKPDFYRSKICKSRLS
jgi:hypothetical protein